MFSTYLKDKQYHEVSFIVCGFVATAYFGVVCNVFLNQIGLVSFVHKNILNYPCQTTFDKGMFSKHAMCVIFILSFISIPILHCVIFALFISLPSTATTVWTWR